MVGNSSSRIELQPLLSPWFMFCVLVCAVAEYLEMRNLFIPYFHYWANDLVAMPVILTLTVTSKRFLSEKTFNLSGIQLLIIFFYVSLIFELALPSVSTKYTADLADVLCYAAGTAFYALVMKKTN